MNQRLKNPIALIMFLALMQAGAGAWDFSYGYGDVFAANADAYIVQQSNVRKYSEWQSPPVTYWGPSANDVQGLLTYRFDFSKPSAAVHISAQLLSVNWGTRGDYGYSSLWGSQDGNNWELLLDNPLPTGATPVGVSLTYDQNVPTTLTGNQSFWLQVRMQEHGALVSAPDIRASWADAQFSRVEPPGSGNAFQVDVQLVPEPSSLALLGLGALVVVFRRPYR
jgi:hypothetical protein